MISGIQKTYFWHHQLEIENSLIAIRPESCERPNSATKLVGFSTFPFEILGGSLWKIMLFDRKSSKVGVTHWTDDQLICVVSLYCSNRISLISESLF
jgi:hypothetical protein